MALPKQVEQQMREVEAIEAAMAAPAPAVKTDPEPVPPPAAAPVAEVVPSQPEPTKVPDWEQRYKVLAGKYDAEVPRLHVNVKELTAKLNEAIGKITELQAAPKQEPTKEKLVNDQDVETYGQDLIDLQRRVAREVASEFQGKLDALAEENRTLREQVNQTGSQVGTMTFEQSLHRALPDFDAINADPAWISWLDEVDPLIRAPRRTVAQEAFENGDVAAIVHYVTLFRQNAAPVKEDKRQADLELQVAPNRSAANSAPTSQQGKHYTTSQVEKLFNKVRDLNIRGQMDEAAKLEAEITAAYAEGRVTL